MDSVLVSGVLLAAFLDTFILTGYLTYGGAISVAALAAFANGADRWDVFVYALIGALLAEGMNGLIANTPKVRSQVNDVLDRLRRSQTRMAAVTAALLHTAQDKVHMQLMKICTLRFFAGTRPINIILYSAQGTLTWPRLTLIPLATAIWVLFWTVVFDELTGAFFIFTYFYGVVE